MRGGKRGVTGVSYVEPTTGAVYPTSAAPYLTVEALFNAKNYWVNMQQQQQQQQQLKGGAGNTVKGGSGHRNAGPLSFDLLDGGLWEYVFIDPMQEVRTGGGGWRELVGLQYGLFRGETTPRPHLLLRAGP